MAGVIRSRRFRRLIPCVPMNWAWWESLGWGDDEGVKARTSICTAYCLGLCNWYSCIISAGSISTLAPVSLDDIKLHGSGPCRYKFPRVITQEISDGNCTSLTFLLHHFWLLDTLLLPGPLCLHADSLELRILPEMTLRQYTQESLLTASAPRVKRETCILPIGGQCL